MEGTNFKGLEIEPKGKVPRTTKSSRVTSLTKLKPKDKVVSGPIKLKDKEVVKAPKTVAA